MRVKRVVFSTAISLAFSTQLLSVSATSIGGTESTVAVNKMKSSTSTYVDTYCVQVGSRLDLLNIAKKITDKYDCPCPRYLGVKSKSIVEESGWIIGKKQGSADVEVFVGKQSVAKYKVVVKSSVSTKDLAKLKKLGKKYVPSSNKPSKKDQKMVVKYTKGVLDFVRDGFEYSAFEKDGVLTVVLPATKETKCVKIGDKCVFGRNNSFLSGLAIRVKDVSVSEKGVVLIGDKITELSEIFKRFEFSNME